MLLFMLKVPPVITTLVGASVLPVLLVQTPPVAIWISPPMVVLVPSTLTAAEVDTLLPPLVAVLPVNVILGVVPFNSKLEPDTKMPPPRLPAELLVKLVVATVVGSDSTMRPPPLAVPRPWLFEKVDVPMDAVPEPMPPGAANAKINKSAPPPPIPAAVLRLKVDPVTVRVPVPPACCGEDGVYVTPPPLPACRLAAVVLVRSVYAPGALVPPRVEFVMIRLPPVICRAPPPRFALPATVT